MAFKKPCQRLKTSAPIKTSERKKMKQQLMETFSLTSEDGDLLVPDPILSFKFNTHVREPGVVFTSAEGEPLWFSLGKGPSDFIPTVYTLWKRPNLLPILSTPRSVIPILANGADLMIPGVLRKPSGVKRNDLVAINIHSPESSLISPPLAVGRMVLDSDDIQKNRDGKAVNILHVYEDNLWILGSKTTPPQPAAVIPAATSIEVSNDTPPASTSARNEASDIHLQSTEIPESSETNDGTLTGLATAEAEEAEETPSLQTLSSEEVTLLLRTSAIQAIHTQLSTLPPASFPIPSSLLYSSYILPCRPMTVLQFGTPVDIKHSSHKNLTSFLKSLEKEGLLKLKDFKEGLSILSVLSTHPEVVSHKKYRTIGDKEKAEEKRTAQEKQEKVKELVVRELWVPSNPTYRIFEWANKSTKQFYAIEELRVIVNEYITRHSLVNQYDQQYINIDEILLSIVPTSEEGSAKFIKRPDIVKHLCESMDSWHEIIADGKEPVRRKGPMKPIEVSCKVGHRSQTTIKFFEPFFVTPEFLSNELRRVCSAAADVTAGGKDGPIVKVQGKQTQSIVNLLISQGIPKRCIEVSEDIKQKKK